MSIFSINGSPQAKSIDTLHSSILTSRLFQWIRMVQSRKSFIISPILLNYGELVNKLNIHIRSAISSLNLLIDDLSRDKIDNYGNFYALYNKKYGVHLGRNLQASTEK